MSSPLLDAQLRAIDRIQGSAAGAVERSWAALGSWDRADVDRFLSVAVPAVRAHQQQMASFMDAYVARALDRPLAGVMLDEIAGSIRNGVPPEEVYARPFVTLWKDLKDGKRWKDGYDAALARAVATAAMDVQLALRATADHLAQTGVATYGYRRVANAGACEFCQMVSGAYVKATSGFVMALHDNCRCALDVLTEPHPRAVTLPDGTEVRPYQYGPLNDSVAVQNHGELGPVLTDPNQHFTAL